MVHQQKNPRYGLITPVRDEQAYVGNFIESVLRQRIKPVKWVIVDDGSTDKTPQILASYASQNALLEVVRLPPRSQRCPGGEGAIQVALNCIDFAHLDFLARFDGDISLNPDYIEQILSEFDRNPRLGIAGGGLYVNTPSGLKLEASPSYHVRGALKMYRRECFQDIGGLKSSIGWDTIDEVSAWSLNWETQSFVDYQAIHHKPTGSGLNRNRVYWERGRADYFTWSSPLFVFGKALKLGAWDRLGVAAPSYLAGFLSCYFLPTSRVQNAHFIKARRTQQWSRMRSFVNQ